MEDRGYEKGNPEGKRAVQDVYALPAATEDRKDALEEDPCGRSSVVYRV